jgi:predicted transcriptional regulator
LKEDVLIAELLQFRCALSVYQVAELLELFGMVSRHLQWKNDRGVPASC